MKWQGYILAFYLILLSAVPCCVFDNCPDDKDVAAHTEQPADHEQGDGDCGGCSPFFNCEGCATATISNEPDQIGIVSLTIPTIYTNYTPTALPTIDYDFWQPPRLG